MVRSRTEVAFNSGLPDLELAALRESLLRQRAFRREQLSGIRRSARPEELPGLVSRGRAEVETQLVEAARAVLADVEAALNRMDTGHYGQCCACRVPVDVLRLRVCPQTLYCARCHRMKESGREVAATRRTVSGL
jgi:DnaK suppressor protein